MFLRFQKLPFLEVVNPNNLKPAVNKQSKELLRLFSTLEPSLLLVNSHM